MPKKLLEFIELPVVIFEDDIEEESNETVITGYKEVDIRYQLFSKNLFEKDIVIYEKDDYTIIQVGIGEDSWLITVAMKIETLMELIGGKVSSFSYSLSQ